MGKTVYKWPLTAVVRECWINPLNRRVSCLKPKTGWIHSIAIESIMVIKRERKKGHAKAFIDELCQDPRFDMVVVEMVRNLYLMDALHRWGWECDPGWSDFFKRTDHALKGQAADEARA
jgi:hypothetical protein